MNYNSTTTLNHIRDALPCEDGWIKLLKHLGKTKADDEPLDLLTVLDSNGLEDALWVLSYAMPDDRLARHFQAWLAEQTMRAVGRERPNDDRVHNQIEMLRNDFATENERIAAREAAQDAAWASDSSCDGLDAACLVIAWSDVFDAARTAITAPFDSDAKDAQEAQLRKMIGASDMKAELKKQALQYLSDTGQLGERVGELTAVLEEVDAWVDETGYYADDGAVLVPVFKKVKAVLGKGQTND